MPVTAGNSPSTPIKIPFTARPEVGHLRPKKEASKAKAQVLALAEEVKSWDNTPADNWTRSGEVMVHGLDYRSSFFKKLFGTAEKITASAYFKNGELQKLEANVYDAKGGHHGGSESRVFRYEKLENGDTVFAAPREVSRYTERVRTGRDKVRSYYKDVDHTVVAHTSVRESRDGTLFVELNGRVPLDLTSWPSSDSEH